MEKQVLSQDSFGAVDKASTHGGRKSKWILFGSFALLILLITGAVGAFFFIRSSEARYIQAGQLAMQDGDWQVAEASFENALAVQPANLRINSIQALALRGEARLRLEKYELAKADLEQSLELDPSQDRLHGLLAETYFNSGDLEKAAQEAAVAQKYDDHLALPYIIRALQSYQSLNYKDAEEAASAALSRDDALGPAHRIRGSVLALQSQYVDARKELDRAIELGDDGIEALAMRVYVNLTLENRDAARRDVETLVKLEPESSAIGLWAQALYALDQHDREKAFAWMNTAIEKESDNPEFYITRAASYSQTSDKDKILADIDKALELYPDFPLALSAKLNTLLGQYNLENPQEEIQRLIDLAPSWNESYLLSASYQLRENDFAKALESVQKAIALAPELSSGYILRAWIYGQQHELEKSLADFQRALEIRPDSIPAMMGMASTYVEQKDYANALIMLRDAQQIDPKTPEIPTARAAVYLAQQDLGLARSELRDALELDSRLPEALNYQASVDAQSGNSIQAVASLNQLLEAYPNNPNYYISRGFVYVYDEPDNARKDAEKALSFNRNLPDAYRILALVAYQQYRPEGVLYNAGKAIELDPWIASDYLLRGQASLDLERYNDAIADFEKTLSLDAEIAETYYWMSLAHRGLKNYPAAIQDLNLLLEKSHDFDLIDQGQKDLALLAAVPELVDGKRTVVDDENGFSIAYPDTWQMDPLPGAQNLVLALGAYDKRGSAVFYVFAGPADAAAADNVTAQQLSAAMVALFKQNPTFKAETLQPFAAGKIRGLSQVYQLNETDSNGVTTYTRLKAYFLASGGRYTILQFISASVEFDSFVEEADQIATTFAFLP